MWSRKKLEQISPKLWKGRGYDRTAPKTLQFDEARPFNSEELKRRLEQHGIQPAEAAGEAHFRLGGGKRGQQVFRAAVETRMEQEKLPLTLGSVREAVFQVSPVMNQLSFIKDYTPAQWV